MAAKNLLSKLKKSKVKFKAIKDEKNHAFVESSVFADKIKWEKGFSFGNKWHYVNMPYMPEGQYKTKARPMNITKVTVDLVEWLSRSPGYDES